MESTADINAIRQWRAKGAPTCVMRHRMCLKMRRASTSLNVRIMYHLSQHEAFVCTLYRMISIRNHLQIASKDKNACVLEYNQGKCSDAGTVPVNHTVVWRTRSQLVLVITRANATCRQGSNLSRPDEREKQNPGWAKAQQGLLEKQFEVHVQPCLTFPHWLSLWRLKPHNLSLSRHKSRAHLFK
jgi:hypothetical protein